MMLSTNKEGAGASTSKKTSGGGSRFSGVLTAAANHLKDNMKLKLNVRLVLG